MAVNRYIVSLFIIGMISYPLAGKGEVLMRNTFEDYECGVGQPPDWIFLTGEGGDYDRKLEDPTNPDYQTQAHGAYSLWLKDPDASSYAHAVKTFTIPAGEEYMIEFYLWIPGGQVSVAGLNICKLFTAGGTP